MSVPLAAASAMPVSMRWGCCNRRATAREYSAMMRTTANGWRFAWPQLQSWYAVPLRLIVGYGFMEHGYAKLVRGPENFVTILHALGVPAPMLMAWLTIGSELVCGAMILAGLLIPLASIPMVATLLVAIFTVHVPNGFSSIKLLSVDAMGAHFGQPGYETDLLYLACLVGLVLGGSGPFALDRLIFGTNPGGVAGPILPDACHG